MKRLFLLPFCLLASTVYAQTKVYTMAQVHSHNDYERGIPFYDAAALRLGSIEADIHLKDGTLYVAHNANDIQPNRTLEELYIKPVIRQFSLNNNKPYPGNESMQLLIDLKTAAGPTLRALQQLLLPYRQYFDTRINPHAVRIVLSGNLPDMHTWQDYDSLFYFDGRPDSTYTPEAARRIAMVSVDFENYSKWNGKGTLTPADLQAVKAVIDHAHAQGFAFRFWGAPDTRSTWYKLMDLGVDVIGTDHPAEIYDVMQHTSANYAGNLPVHTVYTPTYASDATNVKSKNVILFIGDGTGLAQMFAGYTANKGDLNIFRLKQLGLSKTQSVDNYHTDSAAGGTALSSGNKTNNRELGMDNTYVSIPVLPEKLRPLGIRSGVLVTEEITGATPAAFYGHTADRDSTTTLFRQLVDGKMDLAVGGGLEEFNKVYNANQLAELKRAGVTVINDAKEWNSVTQGRTLVILSDSVVTSMEQGRGDYLKTMLQKTLKQLSNDKGFFLMVEGSRIDHGGHFNNLDYLVREMLDFDDAIGEAIRFADQNKETTIVITADHETSGLALMDGNIGEGWLRGHFATNDHTGIPVMVFAYGPNSQLFRGVYENTEIYKKILTCFRIK
ncbi:alkaline phosphatase [Chitinophaga sp. Cy-1792]|uniref:alkaline phosphatase n=1 Tax=Chitinophaga sp. Cy-1792 TaxID=2608339 RepID=UPI001423D60A